MSKYPRIDLRQGKTYPLSERENLVSIADFAQPLVPGSTFREFLDRLCKISHRTDSAGDLRRVVTAMAEARARKRAIIWGLGPHVIKYGLSPIVLQLMDAGWITAIAMNGAGAIHDTEIALQGATSEEMTGQIDRGRFGMWEETGAFLHAAAARAAAEDLGFGEALGAMLIEHNAPHRAFSLLAGAFAREIPMTIHVAIGTDIVHIHPRMDGAATGKATENDFRILAHEVGRLSGGGVHLNIGSQVVLPEVFLKALTIANNLRSEPVRGFTTVAIDHESRYRPLMNVVRRPTEHSGQGIEIVGRMEILLPLLAQILLETPE